MKFGNRAQNIPCTNKFTNQTFITTQNHGYEVDRESLVKPWQELFVNANDGSNEGIIHTDLPYFSVQFHPEACPGPCDTEYLFDTFVQSMIACKGKGVGNLVKLDTIKVEMNDFRIRPKKVCSIH